MAECENSLNAYTIQHYANSWLNVTFQMCHHFLNNFPHLSVISKDIPNQ